MGVWENKFKIFVCKMSFCEIWHLFSRAPKRNFLWCYYRWLIYSLALELKVKTNAVCFKLFWDKGFVHWKLKLLNFLTDSVFKLNLRFKLSNLDSNFALTLGYINLALNNSTQDLGFHRSLRSRCRFFIHLFSQVVVLCKHFG